MQFCLEFFIKKNILQVNCVNKMITTTQQR